MVYTRLGDGNTEMMDSKRKPLMASYKTGSPNGHVVKNGMHPTQKPTHGKTEKVQIEIDNQTTLTSSLGGKILICHFLPIDRPFLERFKRQRHSRETAWTRAAL